MDLQSISFCGPTQIGTDLFTHMSVAPTTPNGTEALEFPEETSIPFPCVVVTFRGTEYVVPMSNVAALVLRDVPAPALAEPVEMRPGVITDESQELGVDVPSSFCTCGAKHFNFEKICKNCTLPIPGRGEADGDHQEEDQQEDAGEVQI